MVQNSQGTAHARSGGSDEQTATRYYLLRKHQTSTHLMIAYFMAVMRQNFVVGIRVLAGFYSD
jgi:hypothetical protein